MIVIMRVLLLVAFALLAAPAVAEERWPLTNVTVVRFQKGDVVAALRTELDRCEATRPTGARCLNVLIALANATTTAENAKAGEAYARRAIILAERKLPAGHAHIALSWRTLALSLTAQGRHADAEPPLRKALELRERRASSEPYSIAQSATDLANNLENQRRHADATPYYRQALAVYEAIERGRPDTGMGWNDPNIENSWKVLALNLDAQGRYAESEPYYRRILAARRGLGAHQARIRDLQRLAKNLQRQRKAPAEVRSLYREAGTGALTRIRVFPGFNAQAQEELRKYRHVFTEQIQLAWTLAKEARR